MENKKISVLALLNVLKEYSDHEHILTQKEILRHLEVGYQLKIDRRTLYQNIDMLQNFGYNISCYEDNGRGYYLEDRDFDEGEIFYLCNAIYASPYIPNHFSKDLIGRVLSTQSRYARKAYDKLAYVDNDRKKDNQDFFINIELLAAAIRDKQAVTFEYLSYGLNKKLIKRREEPYNVSPYLLIQFADKTYLVGRSNNHSDRLVHFRVDKIRNIINDSEHSFIPKAKNEDPYEYARNRIYMYGGEEERITIRFDKQIIDDIIDLFGTRISIEKEDDTHCLAYVRSTRQGLSYLALQYVRHMEVLEPEDLRDDIRKMLADGLNKYEK